MGIFNSRIPKAADKAADAFAYLINGNTDLRLHHPASVGGTINSFRNTTDAVSRAADSIHTKVDSIDFVKISFTAKVSAAFATCVAIQSDLDQKRIATALEDITKAIARGIDARYNSYQAGNKGFPVQVLDLANEVAGKRKSRFVLAFHPSNLQDPNIYNLLSNPDLEWTHLNPQTCFFQVFHDWSFLVKHVVHICNMPDYQKSEPICIVFPSNCSSILNDIFCDIPAKGGLDPTAVSFHGQLDFEGMPLTWLPAELTICGESLYASANVSALGFISMDKRPPRLASLLFCALAAGCFLGMSIALAAETDQDAAGGFLIFSLVFMVIGFIDYREKEVVVRRKRSDDGLTLLVNRTDKHKVDCNRPCEFQPECTAKAARM